MSLDHRVVTIAARNYISRTAVLARSYSAHHPGRRLVILLVDGDGKSIPTSPDFDIATTADLPLDADEVRRMAMIYDVTEFCTSLKPWALQMLLGAGADVATYLDPDIEIFAALDELAEAARDHSIALTPHTLDPFPRDGLQPTESDIMLAGAFNLGYISVSPAGQPMLDWWKERLQRHSVVAPDKGVFVDQRWIDMVPSYFHHTIIKDPGYNVAYWNLHERTLTQEGRQIRVNDQPLRFFHYSGYRVDRPWILNKYYAERPRVLMSEHPVVYGLCDEYRRQLREAEARFGSVDQPYGFANLRDGTPITPWLRVAYRQALVEAEEKDDPLPPAPFGADHDAEFIKWLRSPIRSGSLITNYVLSLWKVRPDLQAAFPEPHGEHEKTFHSWAVGPHSDLPPEWVGASLYSPELTNGPRRPLSVVPGLNVSGYFKAELGVGEAGRRIAEAVRASGLAYRTDLSSDTESRQNETFVETTSEFTYPISVAAVNADVFRRWANTIGSDLLRDTYVIGHWAWELEEFQDHAGSLQLVDEVWANSDFTRNAISKRTDKPVYAFPLPVKTPQPSVPLDRRGIGLPDAPYFLFVFDFLSVFDRKNPLAVIEAFKLAFNEGDAYQLVIKSVNGHRRPSDRERLRLACLGRANIHLLEEYLEPGQVGALMNEAIAYVSLHRSEGLGFTMAEAMSYGRPVIATAYSGNLEFMDDESALLVPFERVEVGPGCDPYPPGAIWAEPDVSTAARHMTWVATHPDDAAALGERARESIRAERSVQRAAEFVRQRVGDIVSSGAVERKRAHLESSPLTVTNLMPADWAMRQIHTAPDVSSPSRHPRLAKRYRQLLYRALAHHDVRVNAQLTAVAQALAEVQSRSADIEAARQLQARERSLSSQVDRIATQVANWNAVLDSRLQDIDERLVALNDHLNQLDQEMVARPYTSTEDAGTYAETDGSRVLGYRPGSDSLNSYAAFEDTYRGTEDVVASMLKPYVPILTGHEPVLEIGSGRGELLELLRAEGVAAFGVDLDESMYSRCVDKGLDVRLGDGLDLLKDQAPETLGSVVSIQVVEHLDISALKALFERGYRALRPGGLLLAETVNPHSPPALKAFWLDLTHVRPLYPESLLMMAQQIGFESARIVFPSGTGELDTDLRVSGSYALLATKRENNPEDEGSR